MTMTQRRGMAMVLVLLALGVGVVLAGVALTARSMGPRIGANAGAMCSAQWTAESAARYAEAVLQSSTDWLSKVGPDGTLMKDFAIGDGTATVVVRAAEDKPADGDTRELLVIATGRVGAMEAMVERHVTVAGRVEIDQAVSLELPGFAGFAGGSLMIDDDAVVGRFTLSPDASTPMPVRLGTGFSSLGSLTIRNKAKLQNTALFVDQNGSSSLQAEVGNSRFAAGAVLPFGMPLLPEGLPSWMRGLDPAYYYDYTISSGVFTLPREGARKDVAVKDGGTIVIDAANGQRYSFDELKVESGGTLRVKGRVFVHVKGALTVQSNGLINYADGDSRVVFFTGDDVTIDNAVIGLDKATAADSSRTASAVKEYVSPARCRILALGSTSGGNDARTFVIKNKGIAVASLHNPRGAVDVAADSTLIGRATAATLKLGRRASLLYDPRLDTRCGFGVLNGPLYVAKSLRPELASAMASFTASTGMSVATAQLAAAAREALKADAIWKVLASTDQPTADGLLDPIPLTLDTATTTTTVTKTTEVLTSGDDDSVSTTTKVVATITDGGTGSTELTDRSSAKASATRIDRLARKLERRDD